MPDETPLPPDATPLPEVIEAPQKPGIATSEFWITMLVAGLGAGAAIGLFGDGTALKIAGVASAMLASVGYTWSRTTVKGAL